MEQNKYRIKDLPEDQRPREKLLKYGAEKLTDTELLAILLRTGTKGKSAIEIANEIIKSAGGSFRGLAGKDISEITRISGIKNAKVITLSAALEINRRISKQNLKDGSHVSNFKIQFGSSKDKKIPIIFRNAISDIPSTTYGAFGIYKYPAKFIPQVIAYILKNYGKPGMKIFDPFAGYGTVGVVSRIYGYEYELWDLNPILDLIHSTAIMKPLSIDVKKLMNELKNSKFEFIPKWSNLEYWFPEEFLPLLFKMWGFVHNLNERVRYLILIPLLKTTKFFSYADEKVHKLYKSKYSRKKIEVLKNSDWKNKFYNLLLKEINLLSQKIQEYQLLKPKNVEYNIKAGIDTLKTVPNKDFDILITSPPYLQAQEYIRSTKLELFWLGYSEDYIKQLSNKEIPYRSYNKIPIYSETYHRIREKIKEQHLRKIYDCYFHSILKAFSTLGEKINNYMFIFVGPAKIRTFPIPIDDIVIEHLRKYGWKHEVTLVDKIVARAMFESHINPASGFKDERIKTEHLVILKKQEL